MSELIAQRLYGLVQGYEDLNDHDQLHHDPMFGIAVGKLESDHARCVPKARKKHRSAELTAEALNRL